jgi:hypothetical protein
MTELHPQTMKISLTKIARFFMMIGFQGTGFLLPQGQARPREGGERESRMSY